MTIELAMAIGQPFWTIELVEYISTELPDEFVVEEHEVEEIRIYDTDRISYLYDVSDEECYEDFRKEDIGETVFLTKEDAERRKEAIINENQAG